MNDAERWGRRTVATGLGAAAFVVTLVPGFFHGALRGPFRIDEAHKISETAFARLAARGDFDHPAWHEHIIDRTNPPVGKYFLGSFIGLSGASLPDPPTLSHASEADGFLAANLPEAATRRFLPALRPARIGSLIATSAAAAILAWSIAVAAGSAAAIVGVALYTTSFLVMTYGAAAVFDPLLALLVACGGPLAIAGQRLRAHSAVALGLISALAFQTRLTGLIALVAVLGAVALFSRDRLRLFFRWVAIALVTFMPAVVVVNPFYWSPPDAGALNPARWFSRFATQLEDLSSLLAMLEKRGFVIRTSAEKVDFLFQNLFGDLSGLILASGIILLIASLVRSRRWPRETRLLSAWAALVLIPTILWLPVAWPRYLLSLIAPAATLAAFGWNELVKIIIAGGSLENPKRLRAR